MTVQEAREIVRSSELSETALLKAEGILAALGGDEVELSDEAINQVIAIIDEDIDGEELLQKANEDVAETLNEVNSSKSEEN